MGRSNAAPLQIQTESLAKLAKAAMEALRSKEG